MGKRWRKYQVGKYRLGHLNGQAVACWRDNAGSHRRRIGRASTEGEAKARLDAFVATVGLIKSANVSTVGDLWIAYLDDRSRDGKQVQNFINHWKALAPRFATLPVDAINADVCRDYAEERIKQGRSAGTIWTELTQLRSALNWAAKRRIIERPPYVWIPQKPPALSRVLTPDEANALLNACITPHVHLFVILGLTTTARSGAILRLKWADVDFEAATIDLRDKSPPNPLLKAARKHSGIVPMTKFARAALQQARAGALSDYVIEWDGEPVKKIRKGFEAACARCGLTDVTPHTLRHTAATWLTDDGELMDSIARQLGHRDPATTRNIYAHPSVETLRPLGKALDKRLTNKVLSRSSARKSR